MFAAKIQCNKAEGGGGNFIPHCRHTCLSFANIQTRNRASWIEHIKEPITSTEISLTKMHYPAESISFFHYTI